jgi:hypothetical protein
LPTPTPQEIDLPDGVVGMDYEYDLGDRTSRYQLISGRMDTGLKILFNQIKGVPDREGKYRFQIRETDPRGNTTDTWYNLKITKALLSVTPDPEEITLDRNRAGRFKITYTLKSSEQLDDTITSARGVFLAGNRTLGTVATPLTAKMTQGRARVSEQVTIPLNVIKTAQRLGIDQIRYQRTFNAQYMDAATTSSTAITVGTGFTITRIKVTFLDHTAKKFVKRNEKIDGARVELEYEGAGTLKGYWQVDDRILARITRNLPFANSRTITLTLPKAPPLPTYSIGSHRLRFVITNPPMPPDMSFPQVIYIVTGEDLSATHPIGLLTPRDNSTIPADGLSFTWKNRRDVATYRFEILTRQHGSEEVLFSAYAKKPAYVIPARVAGKKFGQGGTWQWRVIGLDRNNKPVAASDRRTFTVTAGLQSTTMVPGRILMLFASPDAEKNSTLLTSLLGRYNLRLEQRTALPRLGRELVILSTEEDINTLVRQLRADHQGISFQPDLFYSTLGRITETHNLDMLKQFLGLESSNAGQGVRVAIIDTGVDLKDKDLAGAILVHANLVSSPYRGELHGTAVASVIGARIDGRGTAGIAPQSGLIALRACEQLAAGRAAGRCTTSSILQALDQALEKKADIVNMSLGTTSADELVSQAIDTAAATGMILVAPAGNDPAQATLSFPASHPKVVSVAGETDKGRPMPNKTVAALADVILPARYVQVSLPGNRTSFMHGTSMASAEAAGLFASLRPDANRMADCRKQDHLIACLTGSEQ